MRLLAAILVAVPMAASSQITLESGIGHQGEMQYRAGYTLQLSEHWQLDTGLSSVRYKDEHTDYGYKSAGPSGHVFAADAVLLRHLDLGSNVYLVAGTGPAVWDHARFGAQAHGHAWMFSNRVALQWLVKENLELGLGARHYSCLWCRPNTSIDFFGLQVSVRFW